MTRSLLHAHYDRRRDTIPTSDSEWNHRIKNDSAEPADGTPRTSSTSRPASNRETLAPGLQAHHQHLAQVHNRWASSHIAVGADNSVIVDVAAPGAQDTQDVLELAVKMRRPEATKDTE
jgi:hypothetical protein